MDSYKLEITCGPAYKKPECMRCVVLQKKPVNTEVGIVQN